MRLTFLTGRTSSPALAGIETGAAGEMAGGRASTTHDSEVHHEGINPSAIGSMSDRWTRKYQPPGVGPVFKSGVPGAAGSRTSAPHVGPVDDGIKRPPHSRTKR